MKKCLITAASLAVVLTFCGKQEPTVSFDADKVATNAVVKQVLTEAELTRFIKAFPVYKAEMAKKNIEWKGFKPGGDILSEVGSYMKANKDLAEIDGRMAAAGMPLKEFWPALVKTTMVFSAVLLDSAMNQAQKELEKSKKEIAAMETKLKDPKTSPAEKAMIKMALETSKALMEGLNTMSAVYDSIPPASRDVIRRHLDELKALFETR